MPKMLSDGDDRLIWVPDGGLTDFTSPRVAEVSLSNTGVVNLSCLVTRANFTLGATGNESVSDPALCAKGNDSAPGAANYEATMDFFRFTTVAEDVAWATFTTKGIAGWLIHRYGQPYAQSLQAGDKVAVYGVITGTPQPIVPDSNGGYRKFRMQFFVQSELTKDRTSIATAA